MPRPSAVITMFWASFVGGLRGEKGAHRVGGARRGRRATAEQLDPDVVQVAGQDGVIVGFDGPERDVFSSEHRDTLSHRGQPVPGNCPARAGGTDVARATMGRRPGRYR